MSESRYRNAIAAAPRHYEDRHHTTDLAAILGLVAETNTREVALLDPPSAKLQASLEAQGVACVCYPSVERFVQDVAEDSSCIVWLSQSLHDSLATPKECQEWAASLGALKGRSSHVLLNLEPRSYVFAFSPELEYLEVSGCVVEARTELDDFAHRRTRRYSVHFDKKKQGEGQHLSYHYPAADWHAWLEMTSFKVGAPALVRPNSVDHQLGHRPRYTWVLS